jgi:hypothetical protein
MGKSKPYKLVERTTIVSAAIADAYSELQSLRDEMTENRDNMEEKFSATQKYQDTSDCVDALDNADVDSEPEMTVEVAELPIRYTESVPTRKARTPSRSTRCSNAQAMLEAAKTELENWVLDKGEEPSDTVDDVQNLIDSLSSTIDAIEGIDFPGMY